MLDYAFPISFLINLLNSAKPCCQNTYLLEAAFYPNLTGDDYRSTFSKSCSDKANRAKSDTRARNDLWISSVVVSWKLSKHSLWLWTDEMSHETNFCILCSHNSFVGINSTVTCHFQVQTTDLDLVVTPPIIPLKMVDNWQHTYNDLEVHFYGPWLQCIDGSLSPF